MLRYKNLLLVEDDPDDREFFIEALQKIEKSINYYTANNGLEALQLLENRIVLPDLIFLDMNMPVINGAQLLKKLKQIERLKQIPVVMFSTTSQLKDIQETKALGAIGFITKPARFSELCLILKSFFIK